jgi:hypothetical protein
MPDLAGLVSSDSRTPLRRLRRSQLQAMAEVDGLILPADAPATAIIPIFEANGITGLEDRFAHIARFRQFVQKSEDGSAHVEVYPVPPPHHTNGKAIDYDSAIEAAAAAPRPEPSEDELFDAERIQRAADRA